jgi:uncharacterized protein DUF6629
MCFSASASFAVSSVLIPAGVYCLYKARRINHYYWVFALYPLVFGIQQAVEGWLWLTLDTPNGVSTRIAALGFIFFSHFFWLFWLPFSCYLLEKGSKRQLFLIFTVLGGLYGLSMFIPALLFADWLKISLIHNSISYELKLIFDGFMPRPLVRGVYALIVLIPLLLSSQRYIRNFGVMIFILLVVVAILSTKTFISVWCYFAAILSLYMLYMFFRLEYIRASLKID